MFGIDQYLMLIKTKSISWRRCFMLTAPCKVIVLLLMIALSGVVCAHGSNGVKPCLFEFTSEFDTPMCRVRLDGLMACDGSQNRIAVYWIEPAFFHESRFFLSYSDFIFSKKTVHYCIYGASKPGNFHLSENRVDPLLPEANSVESAVRSALAILNRMRSESETTDVPLELARFFGESRHRAQYSQRVLPEEPNNDDMPGDTASDVQILNALPYGRKYSKYTRKDGALEWSARRALNDQLVVRLKVKPISSMGMDDSVSMFDPNTLGQWTRIPDYYRTYWSFGQVYLELKDSSDHGVPIREFYDEIESYLDNNETPAHVCLGLNRLRFKTALKTGDIDRVSRSSQAFVTALCQDVSVTKHLRLIELGENIGLIQEQYPLQAEDLIRLLTEQMVKHLGSDAPSSLERFLLPIDRNKWFSYGRLLLEEARRQGLVEKDIAETLDARLETARLAGERSPSDPCESSATVTQYLAQLDEDPPKGTITMGDIRNILTKGLARYGGDTNPRVIEDVVQSVRMIAGEGPFRGDQSRLIESIERFSEIYYVVNKTREPIDTVLATFMALSFCDISTTEDHDELFSQFRRLSAEFQSLTNSMLAERELSSLIDQNDVEGVFSIYEKIFRHYIDDPLWPAFKFPLTANEKTRIINKLKQRFTKLEPLLDEVSHMVKYGGQSKKLKDETVRGISLAAQSLLPVTAFIRRPSYPGVSCQHRGKYGFTAVIKGPLYRNGNRPKEKFKAMKYFHLGHRLEQIVKRERELTRTRPE